MRADLIKGELISTVKSLIKKKQYNSELLCKMKQMLPEEIDLEIKIIACNREDIKIYNI